MATPSTVATGPTASMVEAVSGDFSISVEDGSVGASGVVPVPSSVDRYVCSADCGSSGIAGVDEQPIAVTKSGIQKRATVLIDFSSNEVRVFDSMSKVALIVVLRWLVHHRCILGADPTGADNKLESWQG
jgi:hypothetical protein